MATSGDLQMKRGHEAVKDWVQVEEMKKAKEGAHESGTLSSRGAAM